MSITREQFRTLLDKYLKGEASREEAALLDIFFDSYKDEVHSKDLSLYEHRIKDETLGKIHQRIGQHQPERSFNYRQWASVAAVISLLITASYFLFLRQSSVSKVNMISQVTGRGQRLTLNLPDGTIVKMNGNSAIQYPEFFTENTREVILNGEAYFKVTHNASKPFIVHTPLANTTVLGTTFNINTFQPDQTEITLVEGKVQVSSPEENKQKALVLSPNEQAVVTQNSTTSHAVDVSKVLGWRDNTLYFTNISLNDAVPMLESWYDVDIQIENTSLNACVINGKYEDQSLKSVLESFKFLFGLNYSIKKNVITLSGKGCK